MISEFLVTLCTVVLFLPDVHGGMQFQNCFFLEAFATEGEQEGFLHLHVLVHLVVP